MFSQLYFITAKKGKHMTLRSYIIRRVAYMILLIFAVLTVNFLIFVMLPGDPIRHYITTSFERNITPEELERMKELFGLDKPLHERYLTYIWNMLTWNFGQSKIGGGTPVADQILERLPNTLILMGTAEIISIIVGVLLGVIVAYKRGSTLDTTIVTGSLLTYSVPIFFIGWLIIFLFAIQLGWFPLSGTVPREWGRSPPSNIFEYLLGRISCLALPTLTLFLFTVGGWILLTRAVVLECITEDYVITARAKGLKERTVLYRHVLKNASLPIVTSIALTFGFLISGAIITETLFSYNGMGLLIWNALHPPDLPVLQAVFYIIALCVIIANFIADMLYGILDPRIKYG